MIPPWALLIVVMGQPMPITSMHQWKYQCDEAAEDELDRLAQAGKVVELVTCTYEPLRRQLRR